MKIILTLFLKWLISFCITKGKTKSSFTRIPNCNQLLWFSRKFNDNIYSFYDFGVKILGSLTIILYLKKVCLWTFRIVWNISKSGEKQFLFFVSIFSYKTKTKIKQDWCWKHNPTSKDNLLRLIYSNHTSINVNDFVAQTWNLPLMNPGFKLLRP